MNWVGLMGVSFSCVGNSLGGSGIVGGRVRMMDVMGVMGLGREGVF